VKPNTIAKSLAIGNPADGWYALDTICKTGGAAAQVTDEEIVDGIKLLAETEGILPRRRAASPSEYSRSWLKLVKSTRTK
jgi:threonine synthase